MSVPRALVVVLAAPLALLAACSSDADPAATAGATATVTVTAAASGSASPSPSGTARCRTDRLRVSISGGNGALGTIYYTITLANIGRVPCTSGGYGAVSYTGGPLGAPIGEPAVREDSVRRTSFVLAPGETATARLAEPEYQNYSAAQCRPVTVQSLRIVPPRDFEAQSLQHVAKVCSSPKVRLRLEPYVKS